MIAALQQNFQNSYVNRLPTQLLMKVGQSFLTSVAIGLVIGSTGKIAILGGAIAVTATLIDALTRPILKKIFPDDGIVPSVISYFIPLTLALATANSLTPWIGLAYKTEDTILRFIAYMLLNNNAYTTNQARAFPGF